ncbi:DUF2806 domain-containing protein [Acidovorax benzenivorans]|uniref:DUF2806 domain-containing protein n=1 Tax=Acidovorax benzenivorans TaxID=2987520 RepID=UPI0023633315|nr:DUF2806 domain-containing protein [Acidovorax benzenivorans]
MDESAAQDEQESDESGLGEVASAALGHVTGLPAPVQKTLGYVLKRLTTSFMEVPQAYFAGKVAEIQATSDARVRAIQASGSAIADQIQVPPTYLDAAGIKFAERIVGKQKNLDAIANKAVHELSRRSPPEMTGDSTASAEISDDWMNTFEAEAENMSSDEMRNVFAKLLAGEVARPGSFSRRAIKVLGQMGNEEAELFARYSSLAIQFTKAEKVFGGLLMTVGERPSTNGLGKYGLDYRSLLALVEYGLVLIDMDGAQQVEFEKQGDDISFLHSGKHYRCVYEGQAKTTVKLYGVVTSQAGKELMQLVTPIPDPQYTERLERHLKALSLRLEEVK